MAKRNVGNEILDSVREIKEGGGRRRYSIKREPGVAGPVARIAKGVTRNDQYWICFDWKSGNAYRVEIVDYH